MKLERFATVLDRAGGQVVVRTVEPKDDDNAPDDARFVEAEVWIADNALPFGRIAVRMGPFPADRALAIASDPVKAGEFADQTLAQIRDLFNTLAA